MKNLLSRNTTHDRAMKTDLHRVKGKSPYAYSKVRGAPLLFILFTLHTTFKSNIKHRGKEKISFRMGSQVIVNYN